MHSKQQTLRIVRLRPDAVVPCYMTDAAAGMDLAYAGDGVRMLLPGGRDLIPTGLAIELPTGYEGQVRPRSGLAVRSGITVLNGPGTIDADYRGEVCVPLINLGAERFAVEPGMRIAQLVIAPVIQVAIEIAEALSETNRGAGGFGHTGS